MRWPQEGTFGWKVLYVVAIIIKPFFLRLQIEGEEHIPRTGGCVVASNHTRGPDYVIVGYASPRQIYYMAKAEIFAFHPLLDKLVTSAGAFPVRRGQGDTSAIDQAVAMVKSGHLLGMFPEGTRSKTGALQRGKPGAARIALGAQVAIVPVVVINSEPVLRDVLKFQRRPLVVVRFGPPVAPAGGADNAEDVQRLTTKMMLALADLLPEERRGYYADPAALPPEDLWGMAEQKAKRQG
jgi:1-acyl-sn-glycerol-3-phosphate acyltransferase